MDLPVRLCPRLEAPIVLAHGLFGFDRIGLGPVTLASYFRRIPGYFRAGGNRVLVSQVPSISSIENRARFLARRIRSAFGGEPVHLIGHSMGGLDARALLASDRDFGLVRSLTTIATPHLGSALADFAKIGFGRVYRLLAAMKIDHGGFLDVTRRSARRFHRRHPVPDGVPCFSVAGDPPLEDVCRHLQRFHAIMGEVEGANDGLVSVASAEAFGEPLPSWPADHFHQMDWLVRQRGPSILSLYLDVLENLASIESRSPEGRSRLNA